MKKKLTSFTALLLLCAITVNAQDTRYLIRLKDKGSNTFSLANPIQYLTQQAIDRRAGYNIAIDSMDLPVTQRYLDSIRLSGNVTILNTSKWLNQVAIKTTDAAALVKISSFPFVISSTAIASFSPDVIIPINKQLDPDVPQGNEPPATGNSNDFVNSVPYYNYGKSNGQVKIHQGDFLHNHGFHGEGMQMAVIDAGFYHYQTLATFDSIRLNNQILGTWDFVNNEASVNEDNEHGMKCLSTISANLPGVFIGTAPKTSFYLYRTEDVSSEYPIEEQNWAAAVERADSLGVPIASTSLGYNQFDNPALSYAYADMNGNTSICARAADIAAKKGMLLLVAAGNEGTNSWHYIITPADADSVLAIGAVDTLGNVAGFSSYGPSSDGQTKPAVASVGRNAYVANSNNGLPEPGNGTSYACPNMAGLVTCLWQAFPEVNNMSIIDAMEKASSKANNPDDRIGFGIPDVKKAFVSLIKKLYTRQTSVSDCSVDYQFSIKTGTGMTVVLERKTATDNGYTTVQTFQHSDPFIINNFSFTDDLSAVANGIVQYRVKMNIDTDTSFYVDSLQLNHTRNCTTPVQTNGINIGPNPVSNDLNIHIHRATAAKIEVRMVNAAGQKIYSNTFQQAAGSLTLLVPMARMSKGMYIVTVYIDGQKTLTRQIIR